MQESSCGGEPFALRVSGDVMAPEFNDGCIIIIDPSGVVKDGIELPDLTSVEGVIIQQGARRRADRKHYG